MKDRDTEIREAILAADQTLDHLYQARQRLDSAGNWGLVDLLGGGFLSTLMKHDRMSDAERELSLARDSVQNLAKELRDVSEVALLHIELDDFLSFADYFFDGMIADWMVQSRISAAKKQTDQAIRKVEALQDELRAML